MHARHVHVLRQVGAKLCRTPALRDRVWTPLVLKHRFSFMNHDQNKFVQNFIKQKCLKLIIKFHESVPVCIINCVVAETHLERGQHSEWWELWAERWWPGDWTPYSVWQWASSAPPFCENSRSGLSAGTPADLSLKNRKETRFVTAFAINIYLCLLYESSFRESWRKSFVL